ncbi:MAG: type II toxin-antitoxin system HicA family toxin [Anaerolineae bacterium]
MRYGELVRRLRKLGCEYDRPAGGSHEIWWNPQTGGRAVIPKHKGREIPTGTLTSILKDLQISPDLFWRRRK